MYGAVIPRQRRRRSCRAASADTELALPLRWHAPLVYLPPLRQTGGATLRTQRVLCLPQSGGLAYATQKLGTGDRASVKANRLRERLGWKGGVFESNGGKPKGMHWKTYQQLKSHLDVLEEACLDYVAHRLSFLQKSLTRQLCFAK